MSRTRIVLADNNGAMLDELCRELEEEFEIVATATNGKDVVDAVLRLDPDIVVLDISMPIVNGLQASLNIRESNPRSKILFLTIHESDEYVSAAFSAGATGYVTKRRLASDLLPAIREVSRGNVFVSPSLHKADPQT